MLITEYYVKATLTVNLAGKLTEPPNSGFWNRWPFDGWRATDPEKPVFCRFSAPDSVSFFGGKFLLSM
jgi:hypothetical protein